MAGACTNAKHVHMPIELNYRLSNDIRRCGHSLDSQLYSNI